MAIRDVSLTSITILLAISAAPAATAEETFHVPAELRTKAGVVPSCTPLRFASADESSGKKSVVETPEGPWGRLEVKSKLVAPDARFSSFPDCVAAVPGYQACASQAMDPFADGALAIGMPLEFAEMVLGAGGVSTAEDWLEWRVNPPWGSPMGLKRLPLKSIPKASKVTVYRSSSGCIDSIVVWGPSGSNPRSIEPAYLVGLELHEQGDPRSALEAWLPFAEAGHAPTQHAIADLYLAGEGVEKDPEEAIRWLRRAAAQYYSPALYSLGYLYAKGDVVEQDVPAAYRLMSRAASLGHQDGALARNRLAASMSPELLAAAEELVTGSMFEPPVLLSRVEPAFPELARVARLESTVVLQGLILGDGAVDRLAVIQCSQPNMGFEEAAIEAGMQWRFKPARHGGKITMASFTMAVDFTLSRD